MRAMLGAVMLPLVAITGCLLQDGEEKPVYASDSNLTRPWVTCLNASVEEKDDGATAPWMIGQAVADECAQDLLSAFRRETNEADRRKAFALTAQKAEAFVEARRRDRAAAASQAQDATTDAY